MNEAKDRQAGNRAEELPRLSMADRRWLLRLARNSVEAAVSRRRMEPVDRKVLSAAVRQRADCFVTLYRFGSLRGCIGSRSGAGELWEAVIDSARASAIEDPRFMPVTPDELEDLVIEISVLTPLRPIAWRTEDDIRAQLKPFVHGVRIRNGLRRALYLPKVWEHFAGASDPVSAFLEHLSQKAGDLFGTMWRDPATTYEVFELSDTSSDLAE